MARGDRRSERQDEAELADRNAAVFLAGTADAELVAQLDQVLGADEP